MTVECKGTFRTVGRGTWEFEFVLAYTVMTN